MTTCPGCGTTYEIDGEGIDPTPNAAVMVCVACGGRLWMYGEDGWRAPTIEERDRALADQRVIEQMSLAQEISERRREDVVRMRAIVRRALGSAHAPAVEDRIVDALDEAGFHSPTSHVFREEDEG